MKLSCLYSLATFLTWSSAAPSPPPTASKDTPAFTYNATHFLLHGAPLQIIGGQMDPQRIPRPYWRDRLRKARAMGLNTIFTYTFWNLLEPEQGQWNNEGGNDIAAYFRTAQEEGLNVVLRPGPYICGEREWGGFPSWLATVPGMVVRADNAPFLEAGEAYLSKLAGDLKELLVENGGPILMVQVENEYGSYGEDHAYTGKIKDILQRTFGDVVLYTNDGTEQWTLEGGSVPGVLAEIDGDPRAGFAALRKYITDPSMKGPLLDGEYYTYSFDSWGYNRSTPNVQGFVDDLDYVLGNESASISLYMVHGGTNFGWGNGALWQGKTRAFTTSYDYQSPIDEAGRTTPLYHTLRETIQKYVPQGSIPDVPEDVSLNEIPEFDLTPVIPLFSTLGPAIHSDTPLTMEALNQSYGFTLYTHTSTSYASGLLSPGDRARDRVIVYVDDVFHGVIDSQYAYSQNISVALAPGTKLSLLVENLGRVDYYSRGATHANHVLDPYKGIRGDVTVNGSVLEGWDMFPVLLDTLPDLSNSSLSSKAAVLNSSTPIFYTGTFTLDAQSKPTAALDTYLTLPAGVRGSVWVNGFHLGRYWHVGPQQSLYLPGAVLRREQANDVVVLEVEPGRVRGGLSGEGIKERVWRVEEDKDCEGCV